MSTETTRVPLVGGSLSSTFLVVAQQERYVRKTCSLDTNREYGLVRWYSQLRKLQSLHRTLPDLFPAVRRYGVDDGAAYLDLEFVDAAATAQAYLGSPRSEAEVDRLLTGVLAGMARIHEPVGLLDRPCIELYLAEEVHRRLADAFADPGFASFARHGRIELNGVTAPAFHTVLGQYDDLLTSTFTDRVEVRTHGNPTLENLLYVPDERRVVFVDPYGETMLDSRLVEYSQLFQSCRSYYELYNTAPVDVCGHEITCLIEPPPALRMFNGKLELRLGQNLTDREMLAVALLEISQFIRMLPFKCATNPDRAQLFYALASVRFDEMVRGI